MPDVHGPVLRRARDVAGVRENPVVVCKRYGYRIDLLNGAQLVVSTLSTYPIFVSDGRCCWSCGSRKRWTDLEKHSSLGRRGQRRWRLPTFPPSDLRHSRTYRRFLGWDHSLISSPIQIQLHVSTVIRVRGDYWVSCKKKKKLAPL
jgi:hypothetical protein